MIMLKVTKKQGCTLCFEDTSLEKSQRGFIRVKDKIKHEIERFVVKFGIYQPVASSKQAAVINPVFTRDGNIGIYDGCKQTINKVADYHKYLIPKTDNIFGILNGGNLQNQI